MKAEARVQAALAEEFGQLFAEIRLQVGSKLDGQPAYKYFDAVSQDKNIVTMVKDYSAENVAGNQTRHARVMRDLYYLSLVKARRRYLYLSKDFYQWFIRQEDASIASGIEVRTILPIV
jgi:hypothetical protein